MWQNNLENMNLQEHCCENPQISLSFHCFLKYEHSVVRIITRGIISFPAHIILKHKWRILKLWSVISRCQRLIRRSSAERYVSWSELTLMELMWYVCALANILLGDASTISSIGLITGTWKKKKRKSQTYPIVQTPLMSAMCRVNTSCYGLIDTPIYVPPLSQWGI